MLLLIGLSWFYFFHGYKSAFEADQQCHYEMHIDYKGQDGIGCDHDTETRQWLLFKEAKAESAAIVLKRFRY